MALRKMESGSERKFVIEVPLRFPGLIGLIAITAAPVSMSLDNVLAVAGAAREHPVVLIFGLSLSILLMGVAARFIASLLRKYRWIAYLGLGVILYEWCFEGRKN